MIYRKPWTALDDCDYGTFSYLIDWDMCSEERRQQLIKEFRLDDSEIIIPAETDPRTLHKQSEYYIMGYQAIQEPKRLRNRNCDRLQENWMAVLCAIAIPIWLVGFPMFFAPTDMPLVASIFTGALSSPLVGIGCGLIANILGFFHDLGQTAKYKANKKKYDEQQKFENWIKGCRK